MLIEKPFGEGDQIVPDRAAVTDTSTDIIDIIAAAVDDSRADFFSDRLKEARDLEAVAGIQRLTKVEHLIDQRRPSAVDQVLHCSKRSPDASVAGIAAERPQVVADDLKIFAEVHASLDVARRWPNAVHVLRILDAEPRREIAAENCADEDDSRARQSWIFTPDVIDQVRHVGENLLDRQKSKALSGRIASRPVLPEESRLRSEDEAVQVSDDVVHVPMLQPPRSDLHVAADVEENRSALLVVLSVGEISLKSFERESCDKEIAFRQRIHPTMLHVSRFCGSKWFNGCVRLRCSDIASLVIDESARKSEIKIKCLIMSNWNWNSMLHLR